jgi:hypothetical protein
VVAGRHIAEAIAVIAERRNLYLISDEVCEHVIFDGQKHVSLRPSGAQDAPSACFRFKIRDERIATRYVIVESSCSASRAGGQNGVNSVAQYGAAAANGPQDFARHDEGI